MISLFTLLLWDRLAVVKVFNRRMSLEIEVSALGHGESLMECLDTRVTIHRCVLVVFNIRSFGKIEETGPVRGRNRHRIMVKVLRA
mgnify:FL=1